MVVHPIQYISYTIFCEYRFMKLIPKEYHKQNIKCGLFKLGFAYIWFKTSQQLASIC